MGKGISMAKCKNNFKIIIFYDKCQLGLTVIASAFFSVTSKYLPIPTKDLSSFVHAPQKIWPWEGIYSDFFWNSHAAFSQVILYLYTLSPESAIIYHFSKFQRWKFNIELGVIGTHTLFGNNVLFSLGSRRCAVKN